MEGLWDKIVEWGALYGTKVIGAIAIRFFRRSLPIESGSNILLHFIPDPPLCLFNGKLAARITCEDRANEVRAGLSQVHPLQPRLI